MRDVFPGEVHEAVGDLVDGAVPAEDDYRVEAACLGGERLGVQWTAGEGRLEAVDADGGREEADRLGYREGSLAALGGGVGDEQGLPEVRGHVCPFSDRGRGVRAPCRPAARGVKMHVA